MTSRSSMVNQRSNNMNTKLRIDNFMLILLLAFMPVAVFAQYNQYPQGSYEGAQTYSDMISGKQPKAVKHNKVREQYEENLKRRHIQRVDRSELKATFIPKGMWMCGTTVNFREWENENQNLLVLKNLNMEGHVFSVSPYVGYFQWRQHPGHRVEFKLHRGWLISQDADADIRLHPSSESREKD